VRVIKLVIFGTPDCPGCKVAKEELANAEYIDCTLNNSAANKFGIMSVPTIILFDDNSYEVDRWVGWTSSIKSAIRKVMNDEEHR